MIHLLFRSENKNKRIFLRSNFAIPLSSKCDHLKFPTLENHHGAHCMGIFHSMEAYNHYEKSKSLPYSFHTMDFQNQFLW